MRRKYVCLVAGLVLATPAPAEQWFNVAPPSARSGSTVVEIDLDTVRLRADGGDGVIRVSFDAFQPHAEGVGYRSFVASAQFDCQRRLIRLTSAAYYALPGAQGPRVAADSSGRDAGMPAGLLDKVPATARRALLKATCTPTQN